MAALGTIRSQVNEWWNDQYHQRDNYEYHRRALHLRRPISGTPAKRIRQGPRYGTVEGGVFRAEPAHDMTVSLPVHQQRAHDRTRTWRQEDLGSLDTSPPDPVRNERKKETSTFPDIRAGQRRAPAPACRVPVPVPAAKMHVIESQPGGWGERKPSPSFLSALQTQQDRIIRKVEAHRASGHISWKTKSNQLIDPVSGMPAVPEFEFKLPSLSALQPPIPHRKASYLIPPHGSMLGLESFISPRVHRAAPTPGMGYMRVS